MAWADERPARHGRVVTLMARFDPGPRPPSPVTQDQWRLWRCAAPVGDGRCGVILTGWERDPMEGPPTRAYRTWEPGPIIRHLPCGHQWWAAAGGWLPDDVAPEVLGVVRR